MSNKSMIVIGGGLAGLATGCYARMNGYKTRIFELHTAPGGLCTAWQRKGYIIDGCIHFLIGCLPGSPFYTVCQELGVMKNNSFKIIKDFNSFLDEKTGQRFRVTADLERLAGDMKNIAPGDAEIIDEFIAACNAMRGIFAGPTPELMELFKKYNMSVADFAGRIKSPPLRWYLTNMLIAEMPVNTMFIIFGLLAEGQLGIVEGGSLNFSWAIAERYQELGGELICGAQVEEILTENDNAVGVRLVDGTERRSDIIVSAADGYSTIFQMLGGKYVDESIKDRYNQWSLFTPIHLVSFGVAREFPDEPPETMILLKEPINTGCKEVDELRLRIFNQDPSLAPKGRTVVQVALYTDFDYWTDLQEDRVLYEARKAQLANDVLCRLEAIYPGISSLVEMTDVATPYTFWRYTRNHRGSWEGWLPKPETVMVNIPGTLPGLGNFYMTGQWAMSAAAIPQVLTSGRSLVQSLCGN